MVTEDDAMGAVPADSWIERFVEAVAERTDAPKAFAVGTAYGVASLLVPPDMSLHYGGPIYGHQFVCLTGSSGSRKTVAIGHGRRVVKGWLPDMALPEPESEGGLAESMRDQHQALLCLPEGGAFLTGSRKGSHKDSIRARLTALWDGDPFGRRTVKDPFEIQDPRLSVLLGVAPAYIDATLTAEDLDNGFLNRFLILKAERERHYPIPPMLPAPTHLAEEWGTLREEAALSWKPCVGWTSDAEEYWTSWLAYCHDYMAGTERLDSFVSRAAPLALKAAMALSIVQGVSTSGKSWRLTKELLEPALWLGMLHLHSVKALLGDLSLGPFALLRRDVLKIIRAKKGATLAQILHWLAEGGQPRRKRDVVEVVETLLAEDTIGTMVRPGKRDRYVPISMIETDDDWED